MLWKQSLPNFSSICLISAWFERFLWKLLTNLCFSWKKRNCTIVSIAGHDNEALQIEFDLKPVVSMHKKFLRHDKIVQPEWNWDNNKSIILIFILFLLWIFVFLVYKWKEANCYCYHNAFDNFLSKRQNYLISQIQRQIRIIFSIESFFSIALSSVAFEFQFSPMYWHTWLCWFYKKLLYPTWYLFWSTIACKKNFINHCYWCKLEKKSNYPKHLQIS